MNLIHIFEEAVSDFPNDVAIKGNDFSFTYSEFDASTHNFAHKLISSGVQSNDRIGLCLDRSPEMMVGIFGILKAGAAYLPVDPSHPPKRIVSLLHDADVKWVVTTSDLSEMISGLGFVPIIPDCSLIHKLNHDILPPISDDSTAYLLFTSGSTGTPKGVLIAHSSVVNLIEYMQNTYPLSRGDVVMLKSPYTFDGSIWELFGWMIMGGILYVTPKNSEKDPVSLSDIILNERISFVFFVPSMLSLFTTYCSLHQKTFTSLKWISVGGEVLPVHLVKTFYKLFDYEKVKLINVYGPTETTVYATTYCCKPITNETTIPIGTAVTNDLIYIVDSNLNPVTSGEEGEICIGGAGVGKGYLNQPELTNEKFVPDCISGTGKMYRTGDIGRKHESGEFYFIGRRDFQIKLRGLRIEIGEIEHTLMQLDEVAECVVLMNKDSRGDDSLTAYLRLQTYDSNQTRDHYQASKAYKTQLTNYLQEWLPAYMHPTEYIIYKSFPLTAHEKIDRAALVKPQEICEELMVVEEECTTEIQFRIRELWKQVLGKNNIGLQEDFFEIGGHSLKVIQLLTLIAKEFGVEIPMKEFYDGITITTLSERILNESYLRISEPQTATFCDVKQTVFPLTPAQTEMWILNNLDPTGLSHNIQVEFTLLGQPDIDRFKQSVIQTIKHEEMFRSVFNVYDGLPMQQILNEVEFDLPFIDLSDELPNEKMASYHNQVFKNGNTLFETDHLPLFALILIRWSPDEFRLLMAVHHLIFDGWSLYLLMKRISKYYLSGEIEKTEYRNADYAIYLKQPELVKKATEELDYWKETLKNIPEQLSLPQKTNKNSPNIGHKGERHWWSLNAELSMQVEQFALSRRITPYVVFMTAYQLALSAAANQHDIVISSPLANRNSSLTTNLIGYYTNMVCIRSAWNKSDSLLQVVDALNNQIIHAISNSTISYGEVAKHLNKSKGIAYDSIFHAIFVLQNWPHDNIKLPDFTFTQREIGNNTSKTSFLLNVEKQEDTYDCWLEYDTECYTTLLAGQLSNAITQVLQIITRQPSSDISAISEVLKLQFGRAVKPTCYVVGEGRLAAQCIKILQNNGLEVQNVITADDWLLNEFNEKSLHGDILAENNLLLDSVDYIFSINNSLILKKNFLALAKVMAVNYHDAPLPRYAGMYATNWALINGEKTHGISWHKITEKVDAGDIVESVSFEIAENDTALSLNTMCFDAAIESFEKLISAINNESILAIPQQLSERSYFGLGTRPQFFGCLSPNQTADEIDRLIRATDFGLHNPNEFMLPLLSVNNHFYTLAKASVIKNKSGSIGRVASVDGKRGFYCKDGFVVPEIIYSFHGSRILTEELLLLGQKISLPNNEILTKAAAYFSKIVKNESYWKKQLWLAEFTKWPILSGNQSHHETQLHFDEKTTKLMTDFAPEFEVGDIVIAAFMLFLLKLKNTDSGTYGLIPSIGEWPEELRETGIFSNMVPVNIYLGNDKTAFETVNEILLTLKKARNAQTFTQNIYYRYPGLTERAIHRPDIVFVNGDPDSNTTGNENVLVSVNKEHFRLSTSTPSRFAGIQSTAENFRFYLENLLMYPQAICSELPIAPFQTLKSSTEILQTTCSGSNGMIGVIPAFWEVVQKYPDHIAIFEAGKHFSYKRFSEDIRTLAACLKDAGVDTNTVVAVSIERTYHYFVSIMAVLHNGAAFLTLDNKIPDERKRYICENAGVSVLLLDSSQNTCIKDLRELIVANALSEKRDFDHNLQNVSVDGIAYIIYTSGSTGLPKGVKISNQNLANFLSGAIRLYQLEASDRFLQFSNLSFDASIEEIFCTFCTGASLYLRTEEHLNPDELLQFVDQQKITTLDLPTSFWRQLIHSDEMKLSCASLKRIIIGGEALTQTDVDYWKNTNPQYELINTYGPTETTVVALACYISAVTSQKGDVPIGRPLPGYKLYIVDKQRNIMPQGLAGELVIAGESVTPGYISEQNNTAFAWINSPSDGLIRCYCTGDQVYSDKDGIVYFIGRTDDQLKIRGFRVEIGEIESQMSKIDGIESCIIIPKTENSGGIKLIAFYQSAGKVVSKQTFTETLKQKLPAYMVPDTFVNIEKIPLTINGKVDKTNLLKMAEAKQKEETVVLEKPNNETEEYLVGLWQKILGISQIGIHDDFFQMGGHSLKAVGLMAEIKKEKGIKIPLASLIQHATISKLARIMNAESRQNEWNCLVPIRPEGTKTPIFLIHGAGLNVLLYKSLSSYLSHNRPIYAFQASGLDGSRPINNSIKAMASEYIEEMLRVQPHGSYILMGFSLGGFIAYEMAMQLTERGKVVKFTGLIDSVSFLAHYYNSLYEKLFIDTMSFVLRPFYLFWLLLNIPGNEKQRFFKNKYKNLRLNVLYYLTKTGLRKRKKIGQDLDQLSFLSDNMMISMNENLKKYKLKPAEFHVDLFKAGKPTFYIYDRKSYGWAKFSKKGLTVHTLPSEHSLLFAPPNDQYFAKVFEKRLAEIEAD